MASLNTLSVAERQARLSELRTEYAAFCEKGLHLDMSRGKPGADILCLAPGLLDCVNEQSGTLAENGFDTRNYGILDGIPEAKRLFADIFGVSPDNVIVGGSSSLNMMFDYIATAYAKGVCGGEPWAKQGACKFLCPVPGYDRHFAVTEFFGIEMINVPLTADGPDMELVETLVKDPLVKGMWCVPMYANPTGLTYSDETVRRLAALKPAAADFRIMWDNAYCLHHLGDEQDTLLNLFEAATAAGNEDIAVMFTSTSKVSFPGSGVAALAASARNLADIKKRLTIQTIGYDKINMLRHVRYFKDLDGIKEQMKRRADVLRPKFETVLRLLNDRLGGKGVAEWTNPRGGYFISVDLVDGCASRVASLMKDAGVVITGAGATFPYHKDPRDRNLRLAPSFPPVEELELSATLFCICAEMAAIEKSLGE